MKNKTLLCSSFISILTASSALAAVTPQVNYVLGSSSFLTASDNSFFSVGDAYVFYGTFATVPTVTSTAQEIEDDFRQLGLSTNNPYSGFEFSSSVNEADFESQRGYLVVSNNADIGLATEMAIISNSVDSDWTFAADLSGSPAAQAVSSDDAAAGTVGAEIVIGAADTNSGFDTIKMVALVPEPSSITLLGIGAVAFLFRRKK